MHLLSMLATYVQDVASHVAKEKHMFLSVTTRLTKFDDPTLSEQAEVLRSQFYECGPGMDPQRFPNGGLDG